MSNYTLVDTKIKKINALHRIGEGIPEAKTGELAYTVNLQGGVINENHRNGIVLMNCAAKPQTEGTPPFEIEVEIVGIYESPEIIEGDKFMQYGIREGHKELWAHLRDEITKILFSMGLGINLPYNSPFKGEVANESGSKKP